MQLLFVVSSGATGDVAAAADLAEAARARKLDVSLFFMDRGVVAAGRADGVCARLSDMGCELVACASSAERYDVSAEALPEVLLGSQDDHAALVHKADRVVAFT